MALEHRCRGVVWRRAHDGEDGQRVARVCQHRDKLRPNSFSGRHGVARLVWYEWHETREAAFRRERQIKKWNRLWKLRLIEEINPGWHDLLDQVAS